MKPTISRPSEGVPPGARRWFPALAGVVFGLVFVKLGTPVIFDAQIERPSGLLEVLFLSWPPAWGCGLVVVFLLAGVAAWRRAPLHEPASAQTHWSKWRRWWLWLPLVWLLWQGVASWHSVDRRLTGLVLPHFAACVALFYAGRHLLGRHHAERPFFIGLLAGFAATLLVGFEQHYGGLEETRRQFENLPLEVRARFDRPDFVARLQSDRIFSTFFYPNAFAGGILLLLPVAIWECYQGGQRWGRRSGLLLALPVALAGLACLYWSGSKAGWLIALVAGVAALLHAPWKRQYRMMLLGGVLVAGLAAFFAKYSGYLAKGATSASARMDYWRVAARVAGEHPWGGTGPGTFSVLYRQLKPPKAEMARLAHNDYLQQACDSGIPGALSYTAFVAGALLLLRRSCAGGGWRWAIWLGLLGWAAQGLVEFGLYIPAVAWPAFLFFGWLSAGEQAPD